MNADENQILYRRSSAFIGGHFGASDWASTFQPHTRRQSACRAACVKMKRNAFSAFAAFATVSHDYINQHPRPGVS